MSALIWSPFPDADAARKAAETLLEAGLIKCANILPGVTSVFVWQGKMEETREVGALFKTKDRLLSQAIDRLEELHPYKTPAIMGWDADRTALATQHWLNTVEEVQKGTCNDEV